MTERAYGALVGDLPAPRNVPAAEVRAAVRRSETITFVIDDDPTGTQSVADVPVLTRWQSDDLWWAIDQPASVAFVLANTRSVDAGAATSRLREIVEAVDQACRALGTDYAIISRSDSTLRGHVWAETQALVAALGALDSRPVDAVLLCPAYFEARRVTIGNVHWAATGDHLVPVGMTEYAQDAAFGYRSSDLREFIEEKSSGQVRAADVLSLSLEDIRLGGVSEVRRVLAEALGRWIVVNAACEEDLRVVALAAIEEELVGRRFVYRTGPSFVRARSGLEAKRPLGPEELTSCAAAGERHGLVVVGSHVALTGRQLEQLLKSPAVEPFELSVDRVLADAPQSYFDDMAAAVAAAMRTSIPVLFTSRKVARSGSVLAVGRIVSGALVRVVTRAVELRQPAFIVTKGGITSHDVACALGINRSMVKGSLLPGLISVWEPMEGLAKDIPFVVFPGNVGDDSTLADVVRQLRGG